MNWKDVDLRPELQSVPSLSSSPALKDEILRKLFADQELVMRAESYLVEHWESLTGSAGRKSWPGRLENGILRVQSDSASVNQEIQLRLMKIKGELARKTGYELKGFRFDLPQGDGRVGGKRREEPHTASDNEKEATPSPFIDDIRRILNLK